MKRDIIGVMPGTKLMRIEREPGSWRLWIHTNDFVLGTYLTLYDDGMCERTTVRVGEGDDVITVRQGDRI